MSVVEVIYTNPVELDRTSSLHVLAFLLVPDAALYDGVGYEAQAMIREAKRTALLDWYRSHTDKR